MPAHRVLKDLHIANRLYFIPDPGNAGTVGGIHGVDASPVACPLTSTGAETRTLGRPTAFGDSIILFGQSVGGTITVTVTGGYNTAGDTTFTVTAANQWYQLISVYDGTNYSWRLTDSYATSNSTIALSTPATPASVATSPGTAAASEITATGGVGGNSTIATTGVGGVGGGYAFTAGAGGIATAGATASTGGAGGAWAVTTGAGGAEAVAATTSTGGAGGASTTTTGAGGAVSAAVSGTATGGAGGAVTFATGAGGAVTATTGTNVGGAGGAFTVTGGVGGAASGATDTGGAGADITLTAGTGGLGDTGGRGGIITLQTGDVGAGGSPAPGKVIVKMVATEKFGFYGNATTAVFTTLGAVPTNVNIDGVFIPKGGIALTDVRNALIDDASGGSGTVAHFIGNQQITTSSDVRVKRNIVPFDNDPIAALAKAPPLVSFNYAIPQDESEFGPNSRGRYLGYIAQELIDAFPFAVNAGSAKDCPTCRAGKECKAHADHVWTAEYQHLVPLLIAGFNRLAAVVKDQAEQIAALKAGR